MLEDLCRRENPDTSEFTRYDRSRIDRAYTDIDFANNAKTNHKIISFTDDYNAITIGRIPYKIKISKPDFFSLS